MLTEFAITPQVFDPKANPGRDWPQYIRKLASEMFPKRQPSPALLSNLRDGEWLAEVQRVIQSIPNQGERYLAQSLYQKIVEATVTRPPRLARPSDEVGWAGEANAFAPTAPVDRVVATVAACRKIGPACQHLHGIDECLKDDFWLNVDVARSLRPVIQEQIAALRSICLHASFIAFGSPYLGAPSRGDTQFLIALVRQIARRPSGFPVLLLDVHTERNSTDVAALRQTLIRLSSSVCMRLFVWPKFLERILLAGDARQASSQMESGRYRWGVHFSHLARPHDDPESCLNRFSLMSRNDIGFWAKKFYIEPSDTPDQFSIP